MTLYNRARQRRVRFPNGSTRFCPISEMRLLRRILRSVPSHAAAAGGAID